jgi:hypothetical protein
MCAAAQVTFTVGENGEGAGEEEEGVAMVRGLQGVHPGRQVDSQLRASNIQLFANGGMLSANDGHGSDDSDNDEDDEEGDEGEIGLRVPQGLYNVT